MYHQCPKRIDLKYPTIVVGVFHLLFLGFRIYEIGMDLYLLEELVELDELTYIGLITLLQLLVVVSLFVGAAKRQHFFLLPWLCFTAPIFCMATAYATLYMVNGDGVQSIINFVFIGMFWFAWYIVFKNYATLKNSPKYSPFKSYKYSSNIKDLSEPQVTL